MTKPIEFDLDVFRTALKEDDDFFSRDEYLFDHVQEGSWEHDHKYQHRQDVYKHVPTGRFVMLCQSRTGSHFTDWDYQDPCLLEAEPRTETITTYHTLTK